MSWIVDFAVQADHRVKIKENENRDKYLDLARGLKKGWDRESNRILVVIGALGTVPKGLKRVLGQLEIGGQAVTIQTTVLLRSAKTLRSVQKI